MSALQQPMQLTKKQKWQITCCRVECFFVNYQPMIFNSNTRLHPVTGSYQHSRGCDCNLPVQLTSPIVTLKTKLGWWASPSAFSITYTGRLPFLVPYSCRICIGVFPGLGVCDSCAFKLRALNKQTQTIHQDYFQKAVAIGWQQP